MPSAKGPRHTDIITENNSVILRLVKRYFMRNTKTVIRRYFMRNTKTVIRRYFGNNTEILIRLCGCVDK